jgi:hypothetical protein
MAHREIGTYWHLFPLQTQARRSIWHGIGADGKKFLEQAFPMEVRSATRQDQMQIELKCGSIWQMAGSDAYNSLVGSNVRMVVFSEWALCDPAAWNYLRPIIRENKGAAIFITTYRGKNHAFKMHRRALKDPDWFASTLTVDDTSRNDGARVLTPEDIEAERREGMSEAMIEQEYYCSPMAAFEGSYYASRMLTMERDGRITPVPWEPALPVIATWDLGMDDHTAIVFLQELGREVRFIGCASFQGMPLSDIAAEIKKRPFHVEHCYLPHDSNVRSYETGKTRQSTIESLLQCKSTRVPSPPGSVNDGIETVRNLLPQVWIDNGEECEMLIDALTGYRTEKSDKTGVFRLTPLHSWESHLADAVRCYAMGRKLRLGKKPKPDYSQLDNAVM